MARGVWVVALALCAGSAGALGDVVDTFDGGVNLGTWRLTSNPDRLYQVEPDGGHPGAYLHGQVSTAVPTWYIDQSTGNPYTGDYSAEGIRSLSFDMRISGGVQVPDRSMTLHLFTTLGTGDLSLGLEAWYVGTDISTYDNSWNTYAYPLDAGSATIPDGWTIFEGDGTPGTDADWHTLVTHIENVTFELGQPGFAYPNLGVWDLGLDNVRLSTLPVPAPAGAASCVVLVVRSLRRRR